MQARIYQPAKSATQSGRSARDWVLEFEPQYAREVEALMGWTASRDMDSEVRLRFPTATAAQAFAAQHRIAFTVDAPNARRVVPKAYADNFKFARVEARAGQAAPLMDEPELAPKATPSRP